jgi:tripartite-type tricarboxylate transporter receptor subunit TctC
MKIWLGAALALVSLCGAAAAQTANYPQRPITIVVTAAPGGVTDVTARALGQGLTKAWGQPVIVENKGGGAHIVGAETVAKAAPDGYTLMVAEAGTFTINPVIYPPGKIPYDTNTAFVPISGLVRINQALLAKKSLPADNAAQLITLAKQKPGELTFGTAGLGSAPHMNIELFENMAGVKFTPVHYRGAVPALNDVRGGTVDLMSVSVSLALAGHPGRPDQDSGHRQCQASASGPRHSDRRRDRIARLRGGHLVWSVRSGRHATRPRCEAEH